MTIIVRENSLYQNLGILSLKLILHLINIQSKTVKSVSTSPPSTLQYSSNSNSSFLFSQLISLSPSLCPRGIYATGTIERQTSVWIIYMYKRKRKTSGWRRSTRISRSRYLFLLLLLRFNWWLPRWWWARLKVSASLRTSVACAQLPPMLEKWTRNGLSGRGSSWTSRMDRRLRVIRRFFVSFSRIFFFFFFFSPRSCSMLDKGRGCMERRADVRENIYSVVGQDFVISFKKKNFD